MNAKMKLILMEWNAKAVGYRPTRTIGMEVASNGGGMPLERLTAQALSLNSNTFKNLNIEAVHAEPDAIKIFVTRVGKS